MIKPSRPDNEEQRLLALQRYQILDTAKERSFEDLVTIATALCGTRMGAVTLVDRDRQWFKARQGLEATQTSRDSSFCGHAIQQHMRDRSWYEQRLAEYNTLLELQNADLAEQSRTDPLTGLPNRRAMSVALQAAVVDADQQPRQTAVALLDIDHFKSVNDLYGHASGDHVLVELARLLRAHAAGPGLAARYGGEEFVVLMPDTALAMAELQCEFLRMAVADLPLGIPLTISVGVAAHRHGDSVEQTLARADAALYQAKHQGRNRVVRADWCHRPVPA